MKKVGIIMGSDSDLPIAQKAADMLKSLGVPYEAHIFSAHRTPEEARAFALCARENGFGVLTTSLASSRWKDLEQVDRAGAFACSLFPGVAWWGQNWRVCGLQERRNEIIKEQNFYNQNFCGCEFSKNKL